jgi:hypothetical protein
MGTGEDCPASGCIQDGRGSGGQVGRDALLEVKRELGVRQQIGIPVTATRRPGDIYLSINMVEPDLGATELAGLPPPGDAMVRSRARVCWIRSSISHLLLRSSAYHAW